MKKIFVGIDVSKHWIDVCVTLDGKSSPHRQFANNKSGFIQMLRWLKTFYKDLQGWLVCMEHTSLYAQPLWHFLTQKGITYSVVGGSQITSGLKIKIGKSDQIDAEDIARSASSSLLTRWGKEPQHTPMRSPHPVRSDESSGQSPGEGHSPLSAQM